jgi:hypothetical protein
MSEDSGDWIVYVWSWAFHGTIHSARMQTSRASGRMSIQSSGPSALTLRHGHAQQTCSILAPVDARGPRSLATSRVNISIIIPKRLRESAASHRPLDDSSRMKACCA